MGSGEKRRRDLMMVTARSLRLLGPRPERPPRPSSCQIPSCSNPSRRRKKMLVQTFVFVLIWFPALFFYLPRLGCSRSNSVRKAARRTKALSRSSSSFSGCLSPDQNSGTTDEDKHICRVSSSQLPSSWSKP